MGLLIKEEALEHVRKIAERERAPMYVVGETTGDHRFAFQQAAIFPSVRVFSNELALRVKWPKYWNFSFSISPSVLGYQ